MKATNRKSQCVGCGGAKPENFLVCQSCWTTLPTDLLEQWVMAKGVIGKRIVARKIFEHVKGIA